MQFAEGLWVGDSGDCPNIKTVGAKAALNVARDLPPPKMGASWRSWAGYLEYAQVGLVDGPGNEVADYCAAVLALGSLVRRHEVVLVYDHEGSRAAAVAVMYLCLTRGRRPAGGAPGNAHCWSTWLEVVAEIQSRLGIGIPYVHSAHVEAYDTLPFGILEELVGG